MMTRQRRHIQPMCSFRSILLQLLLLGACVNIVKGWSSPPSSRRKLLEQSWTAAIASTLPAVGSPPAHASEASSSVNELPLVLRDFTKLAPLGAAKTTTAKEQQGKTLNLSLTELARRLEEDLTLGHTGQGGYFISGDIDESIFRDDCVFVDPTNRVASLSQYRNALRILFDPQQSYVQLVRPIQVNEQERTIQATIRSRGVLQLPWQPYITAYESFIVYTVDDDTGLIKEQSQTWSKAATKALQESFTPGFFRPAPKSTIPKSKDEPKLVTQLFELVNGRRSYEYMTNEEIEIGRLLDEITAPAATATINNCNPTFRPEWLPGKWMLVYLQPGPNGSGIDRRIPFPDLPFLNDNFQIFTRDSVTNIGQLIGPWLQVQVQGSLREAVPGNLDVPKRFVAQINGGSICLNQDSACLDLPIAGEGLFDSVFLGERIRIGQNINGGGARVVQVKLE